MVDVNQNTKTQSGPMPKSQASSSSNDKKQEELVEAKKEKIIKEKLTTATKHATSDQQKARLNRVDEYIDKVEHGVVAQQAKKQAAFDIELTENKEEKLRRLEGAIKNNLTGYDLEKEM